MIPVAQVVPGVQAGRGVAERAAVAKQSFDKQSFMELRFAFPAPLR